VNWIYLSPHFDDVAFSCGGLLWEQAHSGDTVNIWTVCGGEPLPGKYSSYAQEHHIRWESGEHAVAYRQQEDQIACQLLGAAYRYLPVPDCIYRRAEEDYFQDKSALPALQSTQDPPTDRPSEHLYNSFESIFNPLRPEENRLVRQVSVELLQTLPAGSELVCPLALGGHTDHRLTRQAVEALDPIRLSIWYYADFPYVLKSTSENEMEVLERAGWQSTTFPISPAGVQAWYEAMCAHKSQLSTFWDNPQALRGALETYAASHSGVALWRPPRNSSTDK
jgi:LmbE family N-acetylglucosaminyl deacetylase